MSAPVSLRPYQSAAVAAVRTHWAAGVRRVCVVLPTGTGKTVVAAALAPDLALVHTTTLRDQSAARLAATTTVRTIQEVLRTGAVLPGPAGRPMVVFIDECHHIAAGAWRRVLALLPSGALVVGVTATPERADGTPLGDVFDAMVSTITYTAARAAGYLAPAAVRAAPGMDPAVAYMAHGNRRPGVIFLPTIAACRAAVTTLQVAGVRAAAIDSNTPAGFRTRAIAAFGRGELDVLASPMALAEGFDAPNAAVCILGRSCVHASTYLQIVNRVTRPDPARPQKTALVVDLVGAVERHGHPLEDRVYSLTGRGIRRAAGPAAGARGARRGPPQVATSGMHNHSTIGRNRGVRRPATPAAAAGYAVGSFLRSAWGKITGALRAA